MQDLVTVIPGGKRFYVYGNESILESALHNGIDLNYGCSNGTCGLCKATLITGRVKKLRHYDFSFRAHEKNQLLLCSFTTEGDITIEARESSGVADIPMQTIEARVNKVCALNKHIRLLHLKTPRTKRLRFLAGQNAYLSIDRQPEQSYPIASCPCDDRNILFHIDRRAGDGFEQCVEALNKNDLVTIRGPSGNFVIDDDTGQATTFIAFDTGFAPIKSLIEQVIQWDSGTPFCLYWIASTRDGHYQDNVVRSWADALDNFLYYPIFLPGTDNSPNAAASESTEQQLRDCVQAIMRQPKYQARRTYLAGPDIFVTCATELLEGHGLSRSFLHVKPV